MTANERERLLRAVESLPLDQKAVALELLMVRAREAILVSIEAAHQELEGDPEARKAFDAMIASYERRRTEQEAEKTALLAENAELEALSGKLSAKPKYH